MTNPTSTMIMLNPDSKVAIELTRPEEITVSVPPGKMAPGDSHHMMLLSCAVCQTVDCYGSPTPWEPWAVQRFIVQESGWRMVAGKLGPRGGQRWAWTCSPKCRQSRGIKEP